MRDEHHRITELALTKPVVSQIRYKGYQQKMMSSSRKADLRFLAMMRRVDVKQDKVKTISRRGDG